MGGSFSVATDNTHVVGTVSWTENSTDIANNTSIVTATMKLSRNNTGFTTYGTGSFYVTINGVKTPKTLSYTITYNSNTIMVSGSTTVTHNSDGTKSITIGWGGGGGADDPITVTASSGTATLATIPRASSLTSSTSWIAGESLPISVSSYNTSFTHDLKVEVWNSSTQAYNTIKTITGVGSSYAFTTGENQTIFQNVAQDTTTWNQGTRLTLITKSGTTTIGSKEYTGTVTSPIATTVSGSNFTVGNDTIVTLSNEKNTNFAYDLTATLGTYTKTLLTKGDYANVTWTTSNDSSSLLGQLSTNNGTVTYTLTTYWINGTTYTKVRNSTTSAITSSVNTTTEAPTFTGGVTWLDVNTKTSTATTNNQVIVQGQSNLRVTLPSTQLATAKTGTSIKEYHVVVNGFTNIKPHPDTVANVVFDDFTYNMLNTDTNISMVVKAVDNRGNSTSVTKTVTVVKYSTPSIVTNQTRLNGFDTSTTLSVSGSISPVNVNNANQNSITKMQYTYKKTTEPDTSYVTPIGFTAGTATYPAYKSLDKSQNLEYQYSWDVKFIVADEITEVSVVKTVSAGQPIIFLDSIKKSVGVNMLSKNSNSLDVNSTINLYPPTTDSAKVGNFPNSTNTFKTYINMFASSGSNDPAYIMHETSDITADNNRGVLHLCPTDDNSDGTDYVSIHGTNDPEMIRLYTSGSAWFGGAVEVSSITTTTVNSSTVNSSAVNNTGFDFVLGNGDQSSRGNSGGSRALVKGGGNILVVNYGNDFTGGTKIDSDLIITGEITQEGIHYPSLQSGWGNYGQSYAGAGYFKDKNQWVHLVGMITGGTTTAGTVIFTLPSGYRPQARTLFVSYSSAGACSIDVTTEGYVCCKSNIGSVWTSLHGVHFATY